MSVDLASRAERHLVGADQLGDRKPSLASADQKLGRRAERIRQADVGRGGALPSAPSRMTKPPPTESQVSSAKAAPSASRAKNRIVFGWRGAAYRVERNFASPDRRRSSAARRVAAAWFRAPGGQRLGRVWFDTVRALTAEAENDRLVGRVAAPVKASEPSSAT